MGAAGEAGRPGIGGGGGVGRVGVETAAGRTGAVAGAAAVGKAFGGGAFLGKVPISESAGTGPEPFGLEPSRELGRTLMAEGLGEGWRVAAMNKGCADPTDLRGVTEGLGRGALTGRGAGRLGGSRRISVCIVRAPPTVGTGLGWPGPAGVGVEPPFICWRNCSISAVLVCACFLRTIDKTIHKTIITTKTMPPIIK